MSTNASNKPIELIAIIEAITLSFKSLKLTFPKNFGVSTESSATSILETNER